ncbi:Proteasome component PCI [Gracilaria domingensis]|nr:Proteasome component PCI [Gracilaria domingensis]
MCLTDIRRNVGIIDKAVQAKELRLLARVMRSTGNLRSRLSVNVLSRAITCYLPDQYAHKMSALKALKAIPLKPTNGSAMDVDHVKADSIINKTEGEATKSAPSSYELLATPSPSSVPEVSAYLHLLVILVLIDNRSLSDAVLMSVALVDSLAEFNRRTMDEINSRAYFYYARAVELTGPIAPIRSKLLAAYRTATLHHDAPSQAVLLNLLLRNYITYHLYDQADKLLSRTSFPETRSNNQLARYLYYTGRVKAVQLDYSEALWNLQQALRKATQTSGLGFRISAQKFVIIVQLLTGEVPSRDVFRQSQMQSALRPYLQITQAVRNGDMQKFKQVLEASADDFEADDTMSLINRLRHNVIKTGLRMLSSSYSRITISEICKRLHLDSPENAEGVVAKAIHDGVIDAIIDHEGGFVRSNETTDVYSTTEPSDAYHTRIQFCLNIYNDAVRAMRFPEKKEDEETPEQRRERLKEQEELAKTLAEEDDDDFEP